ncbi:MAG: fasciclin domain-containing protein [Microcystaceae cyanobacterium]
MFRSAHCNFGQLKALVATVAVFSLSFATATPSIADSVLSNPSTESILAEAKQKNIVETAKSVGSFETLLAAIEAADLKETLATKGPLTVFAPTDEAFAALPDGTVEMLLKPENKDKLVKVLTYHVVSGQAESGDLKEGSLTTLEGSPVMIKLGNKVKINQATVITKDVQATNGVIHVIDQVILPPDM